MRVFEPTRIGGAELRNRLLRSATFEAMCDAEGRPGRAYIDFYSHLSLQGLGGIITGFAYVSRDGRALQPGQAGIESDEKVRLFRRVTDEVHANGCPLFLQLAHAGRQTGPKATGGTVYGPSRKKSPYFKARTERLTLGQIEAIIEAFAAAARRARQAGFDGVQLHAAHGYLLHQFLYRNINDRNDAFGVDACSRIGSELLGRVIARVREVCGRDFPLLVKISASDAYRQTTAESEFRSVIRFLDSAGVDALEVSYGTMDDALNIFRGAIPVNDILECNFRYATRNSVKKWLWRKLLLPILRRRFLPFAAAYNLSWARAARQETRLPLISVGGFRRGAEIRQAIEQDGIDFVALCRPLLREPDFALKLARDPEYSSSCRNCNRCVIRCDSGEPTRCWSGHQDGGNSAGFQADPPPIRNRRPAETLLAQQR
jgi:2,4-dienoyl-CoA reductase-like NADH-dependent reductase (Old Yellow Enzyme family)